MSWKQIYPRARTASQHAVIITPFRHLVRPRPHLRDLKTSMIASEQRTVAVPRYLHSRRKNGSIHPEDGQDHSGISQGLGSASKSIRPMQSNTHLLLLVLVSGSLLFSLPFLPFSFSPERALQQHTYQSYKVLETRKVSGDLVLLKIGMEKSRSLFRPAEEDVTWQQSTEGMKGQEGSKEIHIQHVYIKSPDLQIERPYTPLNDVCEDGTMSLLVKRIKGGEVGRHIHALREGDDIEIRGPILTAIVPLSAFDHIISIVTGTGLAPISQLFSKIASRSSAKNTTMPLSIPSISLVQYRSDSQKALEFPIAKPGLDVVANEGIWTSKVAERMGTRVEVFKAKRGEALSEEVMKALEAPGRVGVLTCLSPALTSEFAGPQAAIGRPPLPVKGILGKMGYTNEDVLVL